MSTSDKDYTIGFKKPPKHTQFQPGQSGNAKGRPKGSSSFHRVIEQELNVVTPITERGKPKQIRKKEIIAKQLVNKAAAGDLKAAGMLLNESRYAEQQAALKEDTTAPTFKAVDLQILNHFAQRVRNSTPLPTAEDSQTTTAQPSPEGNPDSTNLSKESTS
ncbi:hypothetical protein ICN11_04085 [Polynucleobacter sp. 78F-HAINBA]|uniref:DUF5681 domain-containing protein n=1 Tax=Polynucleobacter sp. 78F-HAINBA TaxID=2689099 RepID=UPI001C0E1CB3|nr:DUF5681 domain-containing protein [Polynucleobacter sp. 78F-HAINBA]MBU3591195.1 hypothetical protein [Polynucleobacter sp. 78F-HAINBA]